LPVTVRIATAALYIKPDNFVERLCAAIMKVRTGQLYVPKRRSLKGANVHHVTGDKESAQSPCAGLGGQPIQLRLTSAAFGESRAPSGKTIKPRLVHGEPGVVIHLVSKEWK